MAKKLYLEDFSETPALKRFYFPGYLASIRYEKEPDRWLKELRDFASQKDLTDWDLMKISMHYRSINDTTNANKYFKLIKVLHPQGEYALQTASARYQERYLNCSNAKDRMKIYAEHKSEFSTWPMNENKIRSLGTTNMVYLLRNIEDYIAEGKLKEWKSNMVLLSERTKYLGYMYAAQRLAEGKIFLDVAQDLIHEATAWREITLFAPRTYIDWSYLSEREFILNRQKDLSDWLYIYEQIFRLQNKNEEARLVAEKAKKYAEHQSLKIKYRPPVKLISIPSPQITLVSNTQGELTLSDFKGKTVVLDFWASWCGPCIEGFKKMNQVQKIFFSDSVVFFYVNTMEKGNKTEIVKKATTILNKFQYPFEVLYDFKNQSSAAFEFSAIPTVAVIDKKGRVRFIRTGADDEHILEEVLMQLKTEN